MVAFLVAGLMVSAVPEAQPDRTFVHGPAKYDVYVQEAESGGFEVQVCVRYILTGTRFLKNSCRNPTAQEPVGVVGVVADDQQELTPVMMYRRRAKAAAKVGNELVNTNTSVSKFWSAVGKAIKKG